LEGFGSGITPRGFTQAGHQQSQARKLAEFFHGNIELFISRVRSSNHFTVSKLTKTQLPPYYGFFN